MDITSEQVLIPAAVTILHLSGDLDGSNYRQVIERAQALYRAGARRLLLDLSAVPYVSSAGLVALNNIALVFSGKDAPDPENGWRALRAVGHAAESGELLPVKLLNPSPRVLRVLDQTGLTPLFQIFDDKARALASFAPAPALG